ncbi:maestro heat-like repeat family member 5 isoform X2 [Numida meleagris]|uniref:maestro heat-like repeat family member 5 isoform X2 n=1 Tax=Numida meleagris TaxID=8996 RepID=UPI000B3D9877|nr:maestro heat-like repeat family member 5 isoform X2 [Numida meleagris]
MDNMLQMLLVSHHTSSCEEPWNILEVLLRFTSTQNKSVCERAMERISKLISFITSSHWQEPFGKFFQPSQRTRIVHMTLEIIGDCGTEDKEWANFMLGVFLRDPATWLTDVPKILEFIQRNLGSNRTSLQQALSSVLLVMTKQFPRDVLTSVLTDLPQCDSTTLDIWKRVLTLPETSERILEELCPVLQDQQLCAVFNVTTAKLGLLHLTMMPPTEENLKKLRKPILLQRFLKIESLPILWLVLRGLVLLSERPETARGMQALLPGVMKTLRFANTHIVLKALNICRNVMSHLRKREASLIALELAQKLLPLFNHVSSEVRECSIRLFKDVTEAVVWWLKGTMKKNVHRGLLPLLFHMSDESPSVAQASGEALVACAKFLNWKKLKHLAKRQKKMEIKEYLLQQDKGRVDEYLWQSLLYVKDSQATVRYEAAEFTALQPLEDDAHPAVRSVATEIIQRCQSHQAEPAQSRLAALCCWP